MSVTHLNAAVKDIFEALSSEGIIIVYNAKGRSKSAYAFFNSIAMAGNVLIKYHGKNPNCFDSEDDTNTSLHIHIHLHECVF